MTTAGLKKMLKAIPSKKLYPFPLPWDRLQPQDVMSRHRGAKLRRRYELLGGISLLSPEYLLSVERWPFHTEPPDHYVLLSHLLDLSVSQLSTLMPLHYRHDVRP